LFVRLASGTLTCIRVWHAALRRMVTAYAEEMVTFQFTSEQGGRYHLGIDVFERRFKQTLEQRLVVAAAVVLPQELHCHCLRGGPQTGSKRWKAGDALILGPCSITAA